MAAFLSKTNLLVLAIQRRAYAASASHVTVSAGSGTGGSRSSLVGKVDGNVVNAIKEESSSAWAPDPRTGYYRPTNRADEIDPVELREMLLNHKTK